MAEREKETIVTTDGGGGGGIGMVAVLLLIVALAVILFLVFGRGMLGGSTQKIDADVKIDAPAKQ
jgi:uncharacterized membrane protein